MVDGFCGDVDGVGEVDVDCMDFVFGVEVVEDDGEMVEGCFRVFGYVDGD